MALLGVPCSAQGVPAGHPRISSRPGEAHHDALLYQEVVQEAAAVRKEK